MTGPGDASPWLVLPGVLIALLFLMAGCQGAGDTAGTPSDFPCTGGGIAVQIPSSTGTYTTAASSVPLAGMVNASYPNVVWSNSATGDSGTAVLWNYRQTCIPPFGCFYIYDWYAANPVPLAMGDNLIKADAYDSSGVLNARICTTITRTGP